MSGHAPKVRGDLEYFDQEVDGNEMVLVKDPVRSTYFRFNPLQAAMLRALDGSRTATEIAAVLADEFDVEIPAETADRFIARAQKLMLLEIDSYQVTPKAARKLVKKAMRKAGFQARAPRTRPGDADRGQPRTLSAESALFSEAFRQVEHGHPRAAAGYLAQILADNPDNVRAKQLYDLIQRAYIKAHGGTTDFPTWVMFNPRRLLTWMSRRTGRFVFGWPGVLAMIAVVLVGASAFATVGFHHAEAGAFDIGVAVVVLLTAATLHELGPLAADYAGRDEIGFMLFYYLQPAAFCDTSSSYMITARRHKMMIQLAGSIVSVLFIATLSIALTILNPTLAIYPGLVLALVLASGLAFMSLIPFIKNDGYYAICDYFGFPNLRDRSFKLLRAWLGKRVLGIETETEELPGRTRKILVVYAALCLVFTTMLIYVAYFRALAPIVERFRGAGLVFALAITGYLMRNVMVRNVWGGLRWVARERRQIFTRRRTVKVLVLVTLLVAPWFWPRPVQLDGKFVLVPAQRADVRSQTAGRVAEILVAEGQRVTRGQPLARLRNAELRARIEKLEADRQMAMHHLAQLRAGATTEEMAVASRRVERARSEVRQQAGDVAMTSRLARASLGTRSSADTARGRLAGTVGEAGAAEGALTLLKAGSREQDLAVAAAEQAGIESQLAQLRSDEALLILRSPIDGVVTTPHLDEKLQAVLAPGELFAEVHDVSSVVAEISLSPSEPLDQIAVGDEVVLRAHGAPHGEIRARVERIRDAMDDTGDRQRIVVRTSSFTLQHAITGLTGHARIYGDERSLAYAYLYLPLQRLIRVRLWSLW